MALTPLKKSLLAGGILVVAVAVVFLKNTPAAVTTRDADSSVAAASHRTAPSAAPSSKARPTGEALDLETSAEAAPWLATLEELAARDPKLALTQLASVEDPTLRALAVSSIASGWAQTNVAAAAEWVAALQPESEATQAALGLVSAWAAKAPPACLGWITGRPPGNLREAALVELADAWSSAEPAAALNGFLALEREEGSERGLHAIVSQWALESPQAAVESLSRLDPAGRRDELLQAALVSLSSKNPELTWQWSDRCADPQTIEHVRSMALEAMAETQPQDAIRLAATGGNSETLLAGIARGWAATNPAAAKAWLAGLTDQELAARLLESVVGGH